MRLLGMMATVATIAAAIFGIVLFSRLGVDLGGFVAVGLGAAAFMAFTVVLGITTVRMMQRREDAAEEARTDEDGALQESGDAVASKSRPGRSPQQRD